MKTVRLLTIVAILALLLVLAVPVSAAPSYCGATHGAFANANGNFGWLGALGGTPGYHNSVGQEPGATGYNNSHVDCNPH